MLAGHVNQPERIQILASFVTSADTPASGVTLLGMLYVGLALHKTFRSVRKFFETRARSLTHSLSHFPTFSPAPRQAGSTVPLFGLIWSHA